MRGRNNLKNEKEFWRQIVLMMSNESFCRAEICYRKCEEGRVAKTFAKLNPRLLRPFFLWVHWHDGQQVYSTTILQADIMNNSRVDTRNCFQSKDKSSFHPPNVSKPSGVLKCCVYLKRMLQCFIFGGTRAFNGTKSINWMEIFIVGTYFGFLQMPTFMYSFNRCS